MKKAITRVILASAGLLLAACGGTKPTPSESTKPEPEESSSIPAPESSSEEAPVSSEDPAPTSSSEIQSSEPEEEEDNVEDIVLADSGITHTGTGVTVAGGVATITKKGLYNISGTISNGSIVVAASVKGEVEIDLVDAHITRTGADGTSAPIVNLSEYRLKVKKYKKTNSTITDNRTGDNGDPAAIWSKGEVGIVGKGALTITSTYATGFGIASETIAYSKNGTVEINTVEDSITAKRAVMLGSPEDGGKIKIRSSGAHAINVEDETAATPEEGEFLGILIQQGEYDVESSNKAIDSMYDVVIESPEKWTDDAGEEQESEQTLTGTFKSTNDNAATVTGSFFMKGGDVKIESANGKGVNLKNGVNFNMEGGKLAIASTDDAIDIQKSSSVFTVSGGMLAIESGNRIAKFASGKSIVQNGGLVVGLGTKSELVTSSGTQYSLGALLTTGIANPGMFKVANGTKTYYVQPSGAKAMKQLYISTPDFVDGDVALSSLTGATLEDADKIFGSLYGAATEEAGATALYSGALSAASAHLTWTQPA